MREVEVKAVVDDVDMRCAAAVDGGGTLVFEGRLEDRRYDTFDDALTNRDEVLRTRTYRGTGEAARTSLEWKGPRTIEQGYRVREEQSTGVESLETLEIILARLGYHMTKAIDRYIIQWQLHGAVTGRMEIWLEPFADGVIVHLILWVDEPGRNAPARLQRRVRDWKGHVHRLKDQFEAGRQPGCPRRTRGAQVKDIGPHAE